MKKPMSLNKRLVIVFLFSTLSACAMMIPTNYITYIYTDVAHVNYGLMSTGMSITNVIALVFSLFTGMIIQKTKTKIGQFRPWILICIVLIVVGTFMTLIHVESPMATFLMITVGYCVASVAFDTMATANYGMLEKFSMGENEARNKIMAANMMGSNVGYTIFAASLLSLVGLFGQESETMGFIGAESVIACCVLVGMVIIFIGGKDFDPDNRKTGTDDTGAVTVKQMISAVAGNKALISVLAAECFKSVGYSVFNFMMVYQCTYVLGSLEVMTITMTSMSLISVVAAMTAPFFIKLFGGRKRTFIALMLICTAAYAVIAFTGSTVLGFIIPFMVASFFEGVYLAVSINCYLDAGEWWYDKTGNDTRAYVMSLQAVGTKIAMTVGSVVLGAALAMCAYSEELDAAGNAIGIATEEGLRMCTTLTGMVPAAFCLICALILIFFHKISDKELEACIARNAERDAAMYGNMEA